MEFIFMAETFISKLSNIQYNIHSTKDLKKFKDELKKYNITLEQYCDLYLKNIAHKKHQNCSLKDSEKYFYKNICLSKETYERIIVNQLWKCELCENFYAASKHSFLTHIKRHHKISFYEYFKQCNYNQILTDKITCGFCNEQAAFQIEYDIINKTFKKIYRRHFCQTQECKNNICLQYFGKPYEKAKNQFQHIGGKTEFLCKIYNTNEAGLKLIGKSKAAKHHSGWKCRLNNFIEKYGASLGKQKYEQRCKLIGYRNTLEGLIDKFGVQIGTEKYYTKLR